MIWLLSIWRGKIRTTSYHHGGWRELELWEERLPSKYLQLSPEVCQPAVLPVDTRSKDLSCPVDEYGTGRWKVGRASEWDGSRKTVGKKEMEIWVERRPIKCVQLAQKGLQSNSADFTGRSTDSAYAWAMASCHSSNHFTKIYCCILMSSTCDLTFTAIYSSLFLINYNTQLHT